MNMNLDILRLAHGLAAHASARQGAIAENIANADTPGYRAKDFKPFSELYQASGSNSFAPARLRPQEMWRPDWAFFQNHMQETEKGAESPNGNTVSIEDQMMRSVEVRHQHELALGVYRKSLDILRLSFGRAR